MRIPFFPIILLGLPLAEIAVFVLVGEEIGALATVALVIATSILGGILLRIQGIGVLSRIQTEMQTGGSPGRDLVHGAMIMIAGFLLLLPGFITDTLGFLLFIPPIREFAWQFVKKHIVVVDAGRSAMWRRSRSDNTIDLDEDDYSRDNPEKPDSNPRIIDHDPRS